MAGERIGREETDIRIFFSFRARARACTCIRICVRRALCRGASGRYVEAAVGIVIENGGKRRRREGERGTSGRERGENRERDRWRK